MPSFPYIRSRQARQTYNKYHVMDCPILLFSQTMGINYPERASNFRYTLKKETPFTK